MRQILRSFTGQSRAVVVGSSGGIGEAFCHLLEQEPDFSLTRLAHRGEESPIDVTDEKSVARAAERIGATGRLDLVINCVGILHDKDGLAPEKSWKGVTGLNLEKYFKVNAIGLALLIKHFCPLMPRDRKSVFASLSARVGSIGDNGLGGWYGYRASKAAQNMLIRTASIELARTHPQAVCVALHPGTVDTPLSQPFAGNRPTLSPIEAASSMLSVIDDLDAARTGAFYAFDGTEIPW